MGAVVGGPCVLDDWSLCFVSAFFQIKNHWYQEPPKEWDHPPLLRVLEALKQASHDLHSHPSPQSAEFNSAAIDALLELETESETILSNDPNLSALSRHLADLKTLFGTLGSSTGHGLGSFLARQLAALSVSRLALSIESEIQAWMDRLCVESLSRALKDHRSDENELSRLLTQLENRLSQGFNRELQDLVLKSKLFCLLVSILCNPNWSKRIREHSAYAIGALISFNKNVFVGEILMSPIVGSLIQMGSSHSIKVLSCLIRQIKSPIVDEIESKGQIPRIITFLRSKDLQMQLLAMDCIFAIGYFGRKESVEAMVEEGVVEKLVELQRSELGGELIAAERYSEEEEEGEEEERGVRAEGVEEGRGERGYLERHPFASCVARFSVQLEVGEGLRQRERRDFKQQILRRVREAADSAINEAKAATIVAEVLWGSTP